MKRRFDGHIQRGLRVLARIGTALVFLMGAARAPIAAAAFADETGADVVKFDRTRSRGGFTVKVLWMVSVDGRFGKVDGNVRIDRFRNETSVDARIDAETVSMNSPRYEEWVKSAEFFDVAHYPRIEFVSEPFPQLRLRKGGDLSGMLTLRGIRQPVTFQLRPSTCDRPAFDCPIEVVGTIRRSEFEMRSRRGTLSDKVELQFSVYAVSPTVTPKP